MLKKRQTLAAIGAIVLIGAATTWLTIHMLIDQEALATYIDLQTPSILEVQFRNEPLNYSLGDLPSDDVFTLLNISDFKFLINNNVCASEAPTILAFVHSAPGNTELRNRIRRTWGQELPLVFLLGETSTSQQKEIATENAVHLDIVQGSFVDAYRNLTYKHVMGFKWAFHHCPGAKYILKTDDDVFVNVLFLRKFIETNLSPTGVQNLIACKKHQSIAVRSFQSKWRVSPEEYKDIWYPPQCSGWAILYSPDVTLQLYEAARQTPFFWIDDVFVTGILATRLNISVTSVYPFAIYEERMKDILRKPHLEPEDDFFFAYPEALIEETDSLWNIVQNTTRYLDVGFESGSESYQFENSSTS